MKYSSDRIDGSVYQTLDDITFTVVWLRLRTFHGNRTKAAKSLGRSIRWMTNTIRKMEKQGWHVPSFKRDWASKPPLTLMKQADTLH